ncbi:hypothetical protein D3C75_814640 [compost metagenome]
MACAVLSEKFVPAFSCSVLEVAEAVSPIDVADAEAPLSTAKAAADDIGPLSGFKPNRLDGFCESK